MNGQTGSDPIHTRHLASLINELKYVYMMPLALRLEALPAEALPSSTSD
jgi:hypothetical protein